MRYGAAAGPVQTSPRGQRRLAVIGLADGLMRLTAQAGIQTLLRRSSGHNHKGDRTDGGDKQHERRRESQ